MGVFPMVLWKNSSSIRSEFTKRSEGRRRSSFPNLEMRNRTRQPRRGRKRHFRSGGFAV